MDDGAFYTFLVPGSYGLSFLVSLQPSFQILEVDFSVIGSSKIEGDVLVGIFTKVGAKVDEMGSAFFNQNVLRAKPNRVVLYDQAIASTMESGLIGSDRLLCVKNV